MTCRLCIYILVIIMQSNARYEKFLVSRLHTFLVAMGKCILLLNSVYVRLYIVMRNSHIYPGYV